MEHAVEQGVVFILMLLLSTDGIPGDNSRPDQTTTHGREFILPRFNKLAESATSYYVGGVKVHLFITSKYSGVCTVNYNDPVMKTQVPFTSGNVTKHTINTYISSTGSYLNCTGIVSLYVLNEYIINRGGFRRSSQYWAYTALPLSSLSKTYLVPGISLNYPLLGLVAGMNNTHVNIKLKTQCGFMYNNMYYKSGETISLTLNVLDVLEIKTDAACDFGGTLVQSDKPIAVFCGSMNSVPRVTRYSYLPSVLQVPPVTAFSTFVIVPAVISPTKRSHLRLMAIEDGTNVTLKAIYGGVVTTYAFMLHHADVQDLEFDQEVHSVISSDKPILVVQFAEYEYYNGTLLSYPDVTMYEQRYVVPSISLNPKQMVTLTVVTPTLSKQTVRINGLYPSSMEWTELPDTSYSVGYLNVNHSTLDITAWEPMFVRLNGFGNETVYAFAGGFRQRPALNPTTAGLELKCLAKSWMVTLDLSTIASRPNGVLYMGESRCAGEQQGGRLIFNISYDQCGTTFEVGNNQLTYKNKIVYKSSDTKDAVQWEQAIQCTSLSHKMGNLHIEMTHPTSAPLSSQIKDKLVDISLYTDSSFHKELSTTSDLTVGKEVFVKVSTPVSDSLFIVNGCDMVLSNTNGQNGAIPLIKDGCSVSNGTVVLLTRNQMTFFKFKMADLGYNQTSANVICDVTFCDKMDLSPKCDQQCHKSLYPAVIG